MKNPVIEKHTFNLAALSAIVAFSVSVPAAASGSGEHEHHQHKSVSEAGQGAGHQHHQHQLDWGEAGEAGEVNRTMEIIMGDIYFEPKAIKASEGETIRFVLRNVGTLIHEFNIGTSHMHVEHQKEMISMMTMGMMTATSLDHQKMAQSDMKHDDANSVLVEPGQTAELIWKFTQAKNLEFACNVPGHYEAGMVGVLSVNETVSRVVD